MSIHRRKFLATATGAAAGAASVSAMNINSAHATPRAESNVTVEALRQAAEKPVLVKTKLTEPVIIESVELLQKGKDHFCRVRSKDGAEGISVDNGRMDVLHPIFTRMVAPHFIGKDARDLEDHLWSLYRANDTYKFQGLALWCPVAMVEFAILDLLGRRFNQPMTELLGGTVRDKMKFYVASGRRDTTPEQEIVYLKGLIEKTGAHAVKYRVGGRMSRNEDAMPGRTDKLIPLSRKELGDKITILADANSSYDPPQAIEVGKMLEGIGSIHYEEPCPFDDFEATKKVTEALQIPIALGEQESSHWRYQSMIQHHVADVVQPDLYYYGGMIRSIRVARMSQLCNLPIMLHLSGGFGFVYSVIHSGCVQNISPWQEYKSGLETYGKWFDPPLKATDSTINVPTGPGLGLADPKELLKGATVLKDDAAGKGAAKSEG
ncbi:MAG TPA: mandelate racemase/muconate lactonizing enzyme family protein [Pirellulales bacterium]|jgi:L-alanine-DL-glutamate epimerase-like enolase superfamily enzyme